MIPNQWLEYTLHEDIELEGNPHPDQVYRCLEMLDPQNVKVVIVGLSPYPNIKDCSGIAFATPTPRRYDDLPFSLKVMAWQLYKEYGIDRYEGNLDSTLIGWVRQGVLLYNTALTCLPSNPTAHVQRWKKFSKTLLTNLKYTHNPIIWTLGKHAAETITGDFHSVHPAALAYNKNIKFTPYFKQIAELYKQRYDMPLDWLLQTDIKNFSYGTRYVSV